MHTSGSFDAVADTDPRRQVVWRILPSKAKMMEKEKLGPATMFVDEVGALRANCDTLGLAMSITPPTTTRFEFSEP